MSLIRRHLYLVGLPGSDKSAIAPLLAERLGLPWHDLDRFIEARTGESIPEIFTRSEAAFRQIESEALVAIAEGKPAIIATGSGVIHSEANRDLMHERGIIVALDVAPTTAADHDSPLLRDDALDRLHVERTTLYEQAHLTVATDGLSPSHCAARIILALLEHGDIPTPHLDDVSIPVALPHQSHTITVGWGALHRLHSTLESLQLPKRVTLVTDDRVGAIYGDLVRESLEANAFTVTAVTIPAGEASKSMEALTTIYEALIAAHAERGEAIIALGGGVVGDLAGFAAASYLRGVPVIQVPTTLLAQVDSAIGGKTGINHTHAKNAIGAFYQPSAIVIDPSALLTLDTRTYHEGWAEIIKYGVALDAELFTLLETQQEALIARDPETVTPIIARCARIKAEIIASDERESGARTLLNYGHTIGHALEATTGYGTLLHGEGVFLGMSAAIRIAYQLGMIDADLVTRQDTLCAAFGAPRHWPQIPPEDILVATRLDKKSRGGRVRWVMPTGLGISTTRDDIPDDLVLDVLRSLQSGTLPGNL